MRIFLFYWGFFRRFLAYYRRAVTRFDVHSPFVADFIEEVLENRGAYYAFGEIARLRRRLRRDTRRIVVTDFGAGSQVTSARERRLADIARFSGIHPLAGRWLFHLVRRYRPATTLELGTSLGISTLYISAAGSQVWTLEGCPATARLAAGHFAETGRRNIHLITGPFDAALPQALASLSQIDLLFLDGNHRREPTQMYFQQCLAYAHPGSIFVLADIHWSKEMEEAWETVRRHPRVRRSIDLFHLGLLFFGPDQRPAEHYTLIRARWKPWRIGLWS